MTVMSGDDCWHYIGAALLLHTYFTALVWLYNVINRSYLIQNLAQLTTVIRSKICLY